MKIWLGRKAKQILLFDIDEDAIMLAYARLQLWIERRKKQTGKKPKDRAQAQYLRREHRKITGRKS